MMSPFLARVLASRSAYVIGFSCVLTARRKRGYQYPTIARTSQARARRRMPPPKKKIFCEVAGKEFRTGSILLLCPPKTGEERRGM